VKEVGKPEKEPTGHVKSGFATFGKFPKSEFVAATPRGR
jgi:hypothetical protein